MTNKRDCLAIFDLDINAFENRYVWFGRIVERDVLDIDHSLFCVDHVSSHFLLVVVTHLSGWLRDQACDLIECALHFGDLLQVGVDVKDIEEDLPIVQKVRGNLAWGKLTVLH